MEKFSLGEGLGNFWFTGGAGSFEGIVCSSTIQKGGGKSYFENLKKGGDLKKIFGMREIKREEIFSKIKGGTQLFKLNLGIEKNTNEDL